MTTTKTKNADGFLLVLVAAGSSSRFNGTGGNGAGTKKEYLPLNGGTVLSEAADAFYGALPLSAVAVAYPMTDDGTDARKAFFSGNNAEKKSGALFVPGGKTRQESVLNALEALEKIIPENADPLVFIHDGARPFITADTINAAKDAASEFGAAVPGMQPTDTQNEIDADGFIKKHLVRSSLCAVQTPQVFRFREILEGHRMARASKTECTDDTQIWDDFVVPKTGLRAVKVVRGDESNKKITFAGDYKTEGRKMEIRTGLGYDKHALVEGRRLMLGGIEIPSDKGEDGHSDGDVLLHAVTDAVLGASALGDIGSYFPPDDEKWKDADSKELLKAVWKDVRNAGWEIGNVDCVIALEKPKFLPHRDEVRQSIAEIFGCKPEQVFVKAKTGEKLGDIGQRRAVEVWATCLLQR